MNAKLSKLKDEIEMLDVLSDASPDLHAARAEVNALEGALAKDEAVIFNEQLIRRIKAEQQALEVQLEVAERALALAERAHEAKLIAACKKADDAERADLGKNKEATAYAMELSKQYGMSIPELRALVD